MLGKSPNAVFFPMICGSAGSTSRLAKAEPCVQGRHEKLHAAVARSAFSRKNAKKLTVSDHCLKLGCGKVARRCSEKHISKSKCLKNGGFRAFFEVRMSKNGTPP